MINTVKKTASRTYKSSLALSLQLPRHHIIARSSGGTGRKENILNLPSDFHKEVNRRIQETIRKVKKTGRSVRDALLLTLKMPSSNPSLKTVSAEALKRSADEASELSTLVPVEVCAGSVKTGAPIGVHPLTISMQLFEKNHWDTERYPRRFEKVAGGTHLVCGSPSGYCWLSHMQTQGSATYQLLTQL